MLERVAEEASLSRLYAGIHYRFDMVAGLALGSAERPPRPSQRTSLTLLSASARSIGAAFVYSAPVDGYYTMLVGLTGDYDIEYDITVR